MVLPGVDLLEDIASIRRGDVWFDSATRQIWVNGRLYGQHDDGQLFPMRGAGLIEWDRGTYQAFKTLRVYNGIAVQSLHQIDRDPGITDSQRDEAIRVWRIREQAKEQAQ